VEIKITSSIEDIEGLIKDIANDTIEIEGRGYFNKNANVYGIMIFVKDDPTKTFDIFIQAEKSNQLLKEFEVDNS
jgi:hypothetical protein